MRRAPVPPCTVPGPVMKPRGETRGRESVSYGLIVLHAASSNHQFNLPLSAPPLPPFGVTLPLADTDRPHNDFERIPSRYQCDSTKCRRDGEKKIQRLIGRHNYAVLMARSTEDFT